MIVDLELRESQGRQPMLHGTLLQEGRAAAAGRSELFTPGSVETPALGVGIAVEHRGPTVTRGHVTRSKTGELRISALATDAVRKAYDAGKRHLSVEFIAVEERTVKAGIREILRAFVAKAAMVAQPEYEQTSVEIRNAASIEERARAWL